MSFPSFSRAWPWLTVTLLAAMPLGLASALTEGEARSEARVSTQQHSREARSEQQLAQDWACRVTTGSAIAN